MRLFKRCQSVVRTVTQSVEGNSASHDTASPRSDFSTGHNYDMATNKNNGLNGTYLGPQNSRRKITYVPQGSDPSAPKSTGPQATEQRRKVDEDISDTSEHQGDDPNGGKEPALASCPVPSTELAGSLVEIQGRGLKSSTNVEAVSSNDRAGHTLEIRGPNELSIEICKGRNIVDITDSIQKELCSLCRAHDKIDKLERQLCESKRELTEAFRSSRDGIRKLQSKLENQRNQLDQATLNHDRDEENWRSTYNILGARHDTLEHNYNVMTKKLQSNELEIRKLQKTEMARLHREEALLDETAKDQLGDNICTKIRAISRPYFRKISWERSFKSVHQNLDKLIPELFASRWTKSPWPSIRDNPDFTTSALVDAVLFSIIATKFFKNPFFRAESGQSFKEVLDNIYLSGREKKVKNMEAWRKQTVGLLKEFSSKRASDLRSLDNTEEIESNFSLPGLDRVLSETRTIIFTLLSLHDGVTDPDSADIERKIFDLIVSSARLAEDWYSRDFRLCIIDVSWLESEGIDWGAEGADKYVTVFPKNKELEENTNYKIAAVITPGFIRYEKGYSEDTEIEIVWEPASVLLEETCLGGVQLDRQELGSSDPMDIVND
ncbi:hypothetical protein TWF173_005396 [Orbilia oligospora]|nr:hypothetical protein TWF173_005396 [Orbilia oligospora]